MSQASFSVLETYMYTQGSYTPDLGIQTLTHLLTQALYLIPKDPDYWGKFAAGLQTGGKHL